MGLNWAEHTVEIAAPIETCFAAIIDYETFPKWQSAVVDTEVLDWDDEGRGKRVRLVVDAKVRKVDYTLDYRYDQPTRIEWDFVEGNGINDADGHYLFEDLKREAERRAASAANTDGAPAKAATAAPPIDREREAALAERAGIRKPRRAAPPPPMTEPAEWNGDGDHSIAELPALVAGRAASVGRRVAEGGIETARDVTAEAASAGLGAARRAVGLGLRVPSAVADRAARLVGNRRPPR